MFKILQECIDFCAEHKIIPKIKIVTADELEAVYEELNNKNDSVKILLKYM